MSYQTQYQPQQQTPAPARDMDMGSLVIGLFAGLVAGLIGVAITYFWGSKLTRQDRLIGAGIGTVIAIIAAVVLSARGG